MRGRGGKNKRIARNVKVTAKKTPKDKSLEVTDLAKVKKVKKNRKDTIESPIVQEDIDKTEDFETPFKGFRPFDISTPIPMPFSSKEINDEPLLFFTPSNEIIQKTDEIPLDPQPKILHIGEAPEIWSKGIENITFKSTEFDFEGFPIQY